jgi:hypothetical protein
MTNGKRSLAEPRDLLGPVRQVAYIVEDVEQAALGWVQRFGVGPWRVKRDLRLDDCWFEGGSIDVALDIASSYSQGVEIELITQRGGPRSMYSAFLDERGPGAQHVCFYPTHYGAARNHLIETGMRVVLEGAIHSTAFAYLDDGDGQVIEIADVDTVGIAARGERAAVADDWDGSDPIR